MREKYTRGKWKAGVSRRGVPYIKSTGRLSKICKAVQNGFDFTEEDIFNMRRGAAAVNLCEGLSTMDLESRKTTFVTIIAQARLFVSSVMVMETLTEEDREWAKEILKMLDGKEDMGVDPHLPY